MPPAVLAIARAVNADDLAEAYVASLAAYFLARIEFSELADLDRAPACFAADE